MDRLSEWNSETPFKPVLETAFQICFLKQQSKRSTESHSETSNREFFRPPGGLLKSRGRPRTRRATYSQTKWNHTHKGKESIASPYYVRISANQTGTYAR